MRKPEYIIRHKGGFALKFIEGSCTAAFTLAFRDAGATKFATDAEASSKFTATRLNPDQYEIVEFKPTK